ncbi:hypothetical protein GPALN_001793 [Globodera pallida]|nr:hypothetical protein GPALN_001793 [Globodera pallida]
MKVRAENEDEGEGRGGEGREDKMKVRAERERERRQNEAIVKPGKQMTSTIAAVLMTILALFAVCNAMLENSKPEKSVKHYKVGLNDFRNARCRYGVVVVENQTSNNN